MNIKRLSGRNFLINDKKITTNRTKDGNILYGELKDIEVVESENKSNIDPKDLEIVDYLIKGFHDWAFNNQYYLEPGFRHIVKKKEKNVLVCYKHLRDDWHDECIDAFRKWENVLDGLKFVEVSTSETADLIIDDEVKGAYAQKRYCFTGRYKDKKPVINAVAREINIWKEWPEFNIEEAILHEIGHALGLGHPGPYNVTRPPKPTFERDNSSNTCMSYFGTTESIGYLDKIALDMIYG